MPGRLGFDIQIIGDCSLSGAQIEQLILDEIEDLEDELADAYNDMMDELNKPVPPLAELDIVLRCLVREPPPQIAIEKDPNRRSPDFRPNTGKGKVRRW